MYLNGTNRQEKNVRKWGEKDEGMRAAGAFKGWGLAGGFESLEA